MLNVIFRTILFYALTAILMRLMGKRQIGELQLPEFTAAIIMSELAAVPISDTEIPVSRAAAALCVAAALEISLSLLCRRLPRIRKLLDGEPVFLIYKGKILEKNLSRTRITPDEIFAQIRNAGIRDISQAEYVVLEQTGKMSVITKADCSALTPEDLGIVPKDTGLSHTVIIDGRIHEGFLQNTGRSEKELHALLKREKIRISRILYMTLTEGGEYCAVQKGGRTKSGKM